MVSAGAANKKAFGIDRAANPTGRTFSRPSSSGSAEPTSPSALRSRPTTSGRLARTARRSSSSIPALTPIARTCDLFLPIRPGRDAALFAAVLQLMIENDWLDHDFIRDHTTGFEAVAASVAEWTPRRAAEVTGIAERAIRQAAEWWGQAKTSFLMHARGIEHSSHGVANCLGAINIVLASGRIGRRGCGLRHDHGPGQRPGRTGARTEVRPAAGRPRSRQPGSPRVRRRSLGRLARRASAAGRRRVRDRPQDRPRRDPRAALDLLQPPGVAAGQRVRPHGPWPSSTSTSPSISF